ncbi:MAG: hypothetical protein M1438_03145 [Deltaproteobacteria bacterium]|nr:hypothetical protein [Deltaproteobacteria bacterium]
MSQIAHRLDLNTLLIILTGAIAIAALAGVACTFWAIWQLNKREKP